MGQGEHPHGTPPGQTPEHDPPGQEDKEKPDTPDEEEDLEPTHPMVDPDIPHVEPHEEDQP
jgi:hypothetical protein